MVAIHLTKMLMKKSDWIEDVGALSEVVKAYYESDKTSDQLNQLNGYERD